MDALTFARDQRKFFENFKIIEKCKHYLALNQPVVEDEMILKLYRSIREFMTIREDHVIHEYREYRSVLQEEYQRIQTKFKDLNAIAERLKT